MKEESLVKNFVFSTAYQILILITPFITAPYVARVLGADGVGLYSFTSSNQMYFSMFAALGTVSYGSREIARNRNSVDKRSQLFWEIETLSIITSTICLVFWGVFIALSGGNKIYYSILTFVLLATMLDISWFYTGMEQFKYTVAINSVFKLLGVASLFIFVKGPDDLAIYTLIMSLTTFLGNLSMWFFLPRFVHGIPPKTIKIKRHFKETLVYFIPTIATSIYTVLDKTLLGVITSENSQNGYYEETTKIINIAKSLTFTSLNSVLGARLSFLFSENRIDEIKQRVAFSMDYILFMGIGLCFGIIAVADRFVPVFFGSGYEPVVFLLQLMSPIIVIIGISNCLGSQYYNPAGLRAKSAKYIIAGATVNLVLNLLLIPRLKSQGAIIASLIAELVITFLYLYNCNGYITVSAILKYGWKKIIAAVLMLFAIAMIKSFIASDILCVVVSVAAGVLTYVCVLALLKDSFLHEIMDHIKR